MLRLICIFLFTILQYRLLNGQPLSADHRVTVETALMEQRILTHIRPLLGEYCNDGHEFSDQLLELKNAVNTLAKRIEDVEEGMSVIMRCEQGWKYYDGNCYLFSDAVRCEQGWKYYDGNCYLFSSPEVSTWQGAKQICKNKNAYLVEIKSNDENSFIKKELTKLHADDSYSVRYYLGGYLNSSVWTWDRSGEPFGYANWIPGEPSNHGGLEHCLEMLKSYNYEWNDYICSANVHFICKKMQST